MNKNSEITLEDKILDAGYDDVIIMDGYDDAAVGISSDGCVVYDYNKMIECLVESGMDIDEAVEWIEYNPMRALKYISEGAPVIMYAF